MKKSFEICCTGKDKVNRIFRVASRMIRNNQVQFIVRCQDSNKEEDFFEMLCAIKGKVFKIDTTINHCGMKYSKKGIPESLIIKVSEIYKKDILSSSNKKILGGPDSLNPLAEKYWERLKSLRPENVDYDEETGRYTFRHIKVA